MSTTTSTGRLLAIVDMRDSLGRAARDVPQRAAFLDPDELRDALRVDTTLPSERVASAIVRRLRSAPSGDQAACAV